MPKSKKAWIKCVPGIYLSAGNNAFVFRFMSTM